MAGIGNTYLDLIDVAKSKDPDGGMAVVIEMLMQMNPMLKDAYAVECNNGTTHRHTIRTGLPTVTWGRLYKGIPDSKSTKAQVDDVTGFVEGKSFVDQRVLDLSDNPAALRLSEAKSFLEAIAQEVQEQLIYGNDTTSPEKFMGLAPRFNALTGAKNSNQIIDAGGAGADNTSIWMVTWGENEVCTLYPKGTQAGVKREDKGQQRVLDASNNAYYGMEEMFTQHIGLAVKDWRYVTRVANIDVSNMQAGSVLLYNFLRKAYYAHEGRRTKKGRTVIYCNSDVLEALDALAANAGASDNFVRLRPMEIQGEEVLSYRGIPIRETDAIVNTEALVA